MPAGVGILRPGAVVEAEWIRLAALLAGHAVMGLALQRIPSAATLHALGTLAVALWVALFSPHLERIVAVAAYLVGCDVLWRMCDAGMPWEFSKYAASVVLFCGLVRMKKYRLPAAAILYFLLLLPGVLPTSQTFRLSTTVGRISTFLSGPLALAACVCFFTNCKLNRHQIHRALLALVLPTTAIWFIAAVGTFTRRIVFGSESIHAASGDFGPNQVSAALGLGALVVVLNLMRTPTGLYRKALLIGVIIAFLSQSALTLSRGGVYTAVGGLLPAVFYLMRDSRSHKRLITIGLLLGVLGVFVIYPLLNSYTGGALGGRFQEKGMTGRETLLMLDVDLWMENPVFGVGIGLSQFAHPISNGQYLMNHNEFTRLLAEHGAFGLIALILLLVMAAGRMLAASAPEDKALAAALLAWSLLFLFVNGMRISAPSFCFGLAMMRPRQ